MPVLAAIIMNHDGHILLAQRKAGRKNELKWEIPGGKLKINESPEYCLARELDEELGIKVSVKHLFSAVNFSYPDENILLLAYFTELISGKPRLMDHQEIRWVPINQCTSYQLSPADVHIIEKLIENFDGSY